MQPILYRPVPTPQPLDLGRSSFLRPHTHQSIRHLTTAFPCLEHDPLTVAPHHLLHRRPIHILYMRVATLQAATLQPSLAFFTPRPECIPHLSIGWMCPQSKEH